MDTEKIRLSDWLHSDDDQVLHEIGDHIIDVDVIIRTVEKRRTCVLRSGKINRLALLADGQPVDVNNRNRLPKNATKKALH